MQRVVLLLTLILAGRAVASAETCVPGLGAPVDLPRICASVLGAQPDLQGDTPVTIRSQGGEALGTLSLRPLTVLGGMFVLSGELPELVGNAALTPIGDASMWPCTVEVDDPAVRAAPVSFVAGAHLTLLLASVDPAARHGPGAFAFVFIYADGAVRLRAACDLDADATPAERFRADLALSSGWNVIVSELHESGDGRTFELRNAEDQDVASVEWFVQVHEVQEVDPDAEASEEDAGW